MSGAGFLAVSGESGGFDWKEIYKRISTEYTVQTDERLSQARMTCDDREMWNSF